MKKVIVIILLVIAPYFSICQNMITKKDSIILCNEKCSFRVREPRLVSPISINNALIIDGSDEQIQIISRRYNENYVRMFTFSSITGELTDSLGKNIMEYNPPPGDTNHFKVFNPVENGMFSYIFPHHTYKLNDTSYLFTYYSTENDTASAYVTNEKGKVLTYYSGLSGFFMKDTVVTPILGHLAFIDNKSYYFLQSARDTTISKLDESFVSDYRIFVEFDITDDSKKILPFKYPEALRIFGVKKAPFCSWGGQYNDMLMLYNYFLDTIYFYDPVTYQTEKFHIPLEHTDLLNMDLLYDSCENKCPFEMRFCQDFSYNRIIHVALSADDIYVIYQNIFFLEDPRYYIAGFRYQTKEKFMDTDISHIFQNNYYTFYNNGNILYFLSKHFNNGKVIINRYSIK